MKTQQAYILNLLYLVCIFGPGQPFLFIVAFINILLRYYVERILLAYYYRRPIMYDSQLNQNTLFAISLAPLIYCVSAAWTFSNQQVFKNEAVTNKTENYYPPPHHYWGQFFHQLTPGTPYIILLVLLVMFIFGQHVDSLIRQRFFGDSIHKIKKEILVQRLEPYFDSLNPNVVR